MTTLHIIPCGAFAAVAVTAPTEREAVEAVADFAEACPSAVFGPVVLRVTGAYGACGYCATDEAEFAAFVL